MSKKVIAFDLGLNFGYCGGKRVHGCMKVSNAKRMFSFYDAVMDLMVTKRTGKMYEAIVYENACFQKGNAIYNFNAQKGILQLVAESLNIDFIGIPVATIKSHMLGKNHGFSGPESKKAIRDKLNKDGWKVTNLNESDAIAVYYTHLGIK
jgi:hypothetical protein